MIYLLASKGFLNKKLKKLVDVTFFKTILIGIYAVIYAVF